MVEAVNANHPIGIVVIKDRKHSSTSKLLTARDVTALVCFLLVDKCFSYFLEANSHYESRMMGKKSCKPLNRTYAYKLLNFTSTLAVSLDASNYPTQQKSVYTSMIAALRIQILFYGI